MRTLFNQPNVDKSSPAAYPSGRVRDNDGSGNGTGVNEATKGDLHQFFEKLMRLYDIAPNDLPDNEVNGFQLIDALRGVASKNDFIYPLSTNGTILSVDIKLSQMLTNEYIVCLASFDKDSETLIKGSGTGTFAITYNGNFKANEYVRVIKTALGVSIIRVADALSLNAMVADALYLKKASQSQENAGAIDTVATTPLSNLNVFARRVNGFDSGNYIAKPLGDSDQKNGLLSMVDKKKLDDLTTPVKRTGWFSGLEINNGVIAGLPVGGQISSANVIYSSNGVSIISCVLSSAMTNMDFKLNISVESQTPASFDADTKILTPVFKITGVSSFDIAIRESSSVVQSLKIHIDAIQL